MSKLSECEKYHPYLQGICNGVGDWPKSPIDYVTHWRAQQGLAPIGQDQKEWDVTMKSRGLGDTVAKFTHATGIAAVAHAFTAVTGVDCGCGKRQEALNQAVAFKG